VNNTKGTKTVDGERAYQIQLGSAPGRWLSREGQVTRSLMFLPCSTA
jgi:hypothetical protein